jgi:oligoendopeptidase F
MRVAIDTDEKGDVMRLIKNLTLCLLGVALAGGAAEISQERDRSKIPEKDKWKLTDIYSSDDAWEAAKGNLRQRIPSVDQYHGKLASSASALLGCFSLVSNLSKEFARLHTYAQLSSDVDTRDSRHLSMVQDLGQIGADFEARIAFIEPEVLAMNRATIEKFIQQEPKLEIFRHDLDDILRRKAHTGTELENKIIADASLMAGTPGNIYGIFSNAEFPFPQVTFSDGKTVKLDQAAYALYRATPNREDRRKVFAAFFGRYNDYRRTFGTQLYAEVKKDMFYMKAHHYQSCLESALDDNNIPVEVYKSLVRNVNANLPTFHRYLKLRKRMLGLDTLHYYDLYAPLVKNVNISYSYEEAVDKVLASLAPLGKAYVETARQGLAHRWVDVYPNTGKRSGAYSEGAAYDVHPYMLLNYNGKYDDMSTLAHELGHTMHSYLANKAQPYPTAQYSIFVAEVASTFNEALLFEHMLKTIKDDGVRLSLLGSYLDNIKGTVFRQTQFAEFELKIHEIAEQGKSLTGDQLNALYQEIARKYYGHDKGICVVDDEIKSEWAYVPHFYYNFYVFQYATSFTASSALSEEVLAGDRIATEKYLNLLRAGGSNYPINLLKKAGIDMTTPLPLELTMKKMNRVMDEIERTLARRKE